MSTAPPTEERPRKLVEAGKNSCDLCRVRRRKCDYSRDQRCCSACVKAAIPCEHTHVIKSRPRRRLKSRRMDNFEDRIVQLEEMLRAQVPVPVPPYPATEQPAPHEPSLSTFIHTANRVVPAGGIEIDGAEEEDLDLDVPVLDPPPVCSSTGLPGLDPRPTVASLCSLQSPAPQQQQQQQQSYPPQEVPPELQERLAQETWWTPSMVQSSSLSGSWQPSAEMISLCHRELPSPHEASLLLQEYLMDFNSVVPLFDRRTIALHFQDCYSGRSDVTGVSWGSLYVVLGIAHHLRGMSPLAAPDDNARALKFLGKCMRRLPDLLMDVPSLALVQCLLGVAIILKGSWQSQSAALFVSTAMRMAQDMGYNQIRPDSAAGGGGGGGGSDDWSSAQAQQEHRVFWIAFILDADLSLRSNRLPTQSLENIATALPDEDTADGAGTVRAEVGPLWKANILRLRAQLAVQQAKIMEGVFSVKARRQTTAELLAVSGAIVAELESFREGCWLFQIGAADLMRLMQRSDMVDIVMLEAAYFLTVCALQTELVMSGRRTDCSILMSKLLVNSKMKDPPCYPHARRFLEILAVCPLGDMAYIWVVLDAVIIATCVLLERASLFPNEVLARDDVKLAEPPVRLLAMLTDNTNRLELMKLHLKCELLLEQAKNAMR